MNADNRKESRFWDRSASTYDRHVAGFSDEYDRLLEQVAQYVHPTSRTLDAACGTGLVALRLAPLVDELHATDLSAQMIRVAERKAAEAGVTNIRFGVANAGALPFADGSLDVVVLAHVLHVARAPADLLAEARRVLRVGGVLLTATDCSGESAGVGHRLMLLAMRLVRTFGILPWMRCYRKADVDALIAAAGFQAIAAEHLSPMPGVYFVAAKKYNS